VGLSTARPTTNLDGQGVFYVWAITFALSGMEDSIIRRFFDFDWRSDLNTKHSHVHEGNAFLVCAVFVTVCDTIDFKTCFCPCLDTPCTVSCTI
jgi:hypothetical protein